MNKRKEKKKNKKYIFIYKVRWSGNKNKIKKKTNRPGNSRATFLAYSIKFIKVNKYISNMNV